MLRKYFVLMAMTASLVAGAITSRAQDAGALLDLLVKKKIITDQEAEEVRSEFTARLPQLADAEPVRSELPAAGLAQLADAQAVRSELPAGLAQLRPPAAVPRVATA